MPYITPPSKSVGSPLGAADWNSYVKGNQDWLYQQSAQRHGCTIRRNVTQSFAGGGLVTPVAWNFNVEDTDGYHSTISNTQNIVIPSHLGGIYAITWYWQHLGIGANQGQMIIRKQGISIARTVYAPPLCTMTIVYPFNGGEHFDCAVYNGAATGSDVSVSAPGSEAPYTPVLYCYKVG